MNHDDQETLGMLVCFWRQVAEALDDDDLREDARGLAQEAGINPFAWRRLELGNL